MNPSYSRPVSLDPLFSQPVSLCVTCFTPVNWLVAMGRPFSSIWKLFGTMSMPCVVPEMLWSLDELKRVLISEFPILETEEGEGFKILFDLFVEWAEILLNYNNQHPPTLLNLGNCGPESFSQGISGRAYSCRIALEGCHRTPEDPIALHTPTHRSSYSTKGIVHQKNLRRQPKTFFFEKLTWRVFFLFGGKMLWNLIIWNMGEIVVFPAFWAVAHTIAFHEILILLTCGGYGNSRLLS